MTMVIPEIVHNTLLSSTISAAVGAAVTLTVTRLLAKTARFRFSKTVERIALSADDAVFGSVRMTWQNQPMRNLYMASIEIENCSNRDFENVDFKVYVAPDTSLLTERTPIPNTPYIVKWSPEYKASIAVAQGAQPTAAQWGIYYHSRDYLLPVFNRGQILHFSYLCTRPNDDVQPDIFVSSQLKGARMNEQLRRNVLFGVPTQICLARGLVICIITVVGCGTLLHNPWITSGVSMVVGLCALFLGLVEYKAERWITRLIAG
jgi:hypothetical protein